MQKIAVNVFASGTVSGAITRSDIERDTFLFAYDRACVDDSAVSLTMPVVPDQYDSMGTVHPIFEMNLPEGLLRHKLELMFSKVIPHFDALSLLELIGKSQIGRLRYAAIGSALEEVPVQNVQKLLAYKGADDLFDDLMERFAVYSGISGMQPKVLIRADTPMDRITHKGATHIVKSFNPKEFPELAANEFFCMQASRHAGLPTAAVQLADNRKLLVVDRFDLGAEGRYLGFEDFCVLSGMRAGGRYNASYEEVAARIAQFVAPERHAESMEHFFGAVALACAVRNGDAHLKNFGILYNRPGDDVRLAPIYDMLSTKPYLPKDVMALELAGTKSYPDRKQLVNFGRVACKLSQGRVTAILTQVAGGVLQASADMKKYAGRHADFKPAAEHLAAVFKFGLAESGLQ
ncbi:MAG: type II toxin-antitoxin system HipA family toxin [Pseudomonadota bacterium]